MHALNREDRQHRKRVEAALAEKKNNAKAHVFSSNLNSSGRKILRDAEFGCICTRCLASYYYIFKYKVLHDEAVIRSTNKLKESKKKQKLTRTG